MTKLLVKRVASSLHPIGQESWDTFDRLPQGKTFVVTVRRSRNPEFLRRYWSVLGVAADHCDLWDDREDADHWVRMQMPSMREQYVVEEDGTVIVRLKSISMEDMDETEFEQFYTRAMELLSAKIGTDVETLAGEVWDRRRKEDAVPNMPR